MGAQRDLPSQADGETYIVDNVTKPPQHSSGDGEPIDIRLDQETTSLSIPSQLELPNPLQQLHASTTDDLEELPAYSVDCVNEFDPLRSLPESKSTRLGPYQLLLPTALHESGLVFNPSFSLMDVWIDQDPDAVSKHIEQNASSIKISTIAEFADAKPHPSAVFVPETLEWRVIIDQLSMYNEAQPNAQVIPAAHLFEACNLAFGSANMYETMPITVLPHQQAYPIKLFENGKPRLSESELVLSEFNMHTCFVSGKKLFSSPPATITTVVDPVVLIGFKDNRQQSPAVGLSPLETFVRAIRMLLRIVGNTIHGESRPVTTSGVSITQKLGWDEFSREILLQLGWNTIQLPDGRDAVAPPDVFSDSKESTFIRKRLLRAWMELSVWSAFHIQLLRDQNPRSSLLDQTDPSGPSVVKMQTASSKVLTLIGFCADHIDQQLQKNVSERTREALYLLGATADTRDDLVKFAYLVNVEASPSRSVELLSCMEEVFINQRNSSRMLQELLAYEKSLGKYTKTDVDKAYRRFQLSSDYLGQDIQRESIPHEFIVDNYKARAREALSKGDSSEFQSVKDALRTISLSLGSPAALKQAYTAEVDMDVDQAYAMLEASRDIDDSTLLVVFDIREADAPGRSEILHHALRAIAQDRDSNFLRNYLKTGEKQETNPNDEWQQIPSESRPAGLNNIGNTCYLNSVLQYFFTIREIRDRVLQVSSLPLHVQKEASVESEEIRGNGSRRVGGRTISKREVERSKTFVLQLAELFKQLIQTSDIAVTPERELAYLALVSSRAEEDQVNSPTISPVASQENANAALSEEPESLATMQEKTDAADQPMDVCELPTTVATTHPSEASPLATATEASSESILDQNETMNDDRNPQDPPSAIDDAPPLPPRPTVALVEATSVESDAVANEPPPARRNSLMQLGTQQDVSECLDNCMFQLEVALVIQENAQELKEGASPSAANGISPSENEHVAMDVDESQSLMNDDKKMTDDDLGTSTDLLTKLFLGQTCQRLELTVPLTETNETSSSSIHTKKEVFKILPIDVVEEGRDIYDGLDGFFDEETLIGSEGRPVRRAVTLLEPPPLLQIQLQRVQYDRKTMRAFKSQAHLAMDQTLYMDRYLDFDPTDPEDQVRLEKRKRSRQARRRIAELRTRVEALRPQQRSISQTLKQTAFTLRQLAQLPGLEEVERECLNEETVDEQDGNNNNDNNEKEKEKELVGSPRSMAKLALLKDVEMGKEEEPISLIESVPTPFPVSNPTCNHSSNTFGNLIQDALPDFLESEAVAVEKEIQQAEETISQLKQEMNQIWQNENRIEYQLAAVFMHRGEASHGHYFLNMRNFSTPSSDVVVIDNVVSSPTWFRYNDTIVSPISLDQVLRDSSGATPYLVTYVRKDLQDAIGLIDPICRSIVSEPQLSLPAETVVSE